MAEETGDIARNNALREYVRLKLEAEDLDRKAKDAKAALAESKYAAHAMLRKHGTRGSTTVDLGPGFGTIRFTPGETTLANVYDERAFHEWIEANGRADELYFPDKLRKKPLNEMVKEIKEHENAEYPPGLQPTEIKRVTITRIKT